MVRLDLLASVATFVTAALSLILSLPFLSVSSSRVFPPFCPVSFFKSSVHGWLGFIGKISLEGVSCHENVWVAPFF